MEENKNDNSAVKEKYDNFLAFTAQQKLELSALIVHLQNAEKSLIKLMHMDKNPIGLSEKVKHRPLIQQGLKSLTTRVLLAYRNQLKQLDTPQRLDAMEAQRQTFLSHIMLYNRLQNLMQHPSDSMIFLKIIDKVEAGEDMPAEVKAWFQNNA